MMYKTRYIPFHKIPLHSNVVIYGAGLLGRKFYQQNQELHICNIVGVVDRNHERISDFPCEVKSLSFLRETCFDYILIAIAKEDVAKEIIEYLETTGIEKSKIIYDVNCYVFDESYDDILDELEENSYEEGIRIGFETQGVIGDNIICLKLYQTIARMAPDCVVDVYNVSSSCLESIYYKQNNLGEIFHRTISEDNYEKYDIVLEVCHEPHLLYCKINKLKRINYGLYESMKTLYQYGKKYIDIAGVGRRVYADRITHERACILGLNQYTMLGISGAFNITDSRVELYIDESYKSKYEELELPESYMTVNYGQGGIDSEKGYGTKMWPLEYYPELISKIKKKYPKLKVVQVSGKGMRKVDGVDQYIIGEPFDVTKYILKNSLLHFDCEGGLVHLAMQLGTKCAVVFGPSMMRTMGYSCNINIKSSLCGDCVLLSEDWAKKCFRFDRPECMYSIKPDMVYKEIEKYLDSLLDSKL